MVSLHAADMGDYLGDWTVRRERASVRTAPPTASSLFGSGEGKDDEQVPGNDPASRGSTTTGVWGPAGAPGGEEGRRRRLRLRHMVSGGLESHLRIRHAIVSRSRDAALVLLNLPPPPRSCWADPCSYFKLCDYLTNGLHRVLFVYGSGTEVLSPFI